MIIHLIAGSHAPTLAERVAEALAQVRGAYSLVVLAQREMIAGATRSVFARWSGIA